MKASSSDERKAKLLLLKTGPPIKCDDCGETIKWRRECGCTKSTSSTTNALEQLEADLSKARMYLSNGAGCYEMEDINYSVADHITTLKNAIAAFDSALALIRTAQSTAKEKEMKAE